MSCVHPTDRQTFVRSEAHPVMGRTYFYRCACGHVSRRLVVNESTVQDTDRRAALHGFRRRAASMLQMGLRAGLIKRPDACEGCGDTDQKPQAHHYDYSRPLEVEWLCGTCHRDADEVRREHESERAA